MEDDAFNDHAPVEILAKEIDLAGEGDDKLPNTLVVTVIEARDLQPAALRSTLSTYVKLSSLGREYKTSVLSKTDTPYWNETFTFRANDWAASVTLSVRDKINVKMRFLGQVRVVCADVANQPGMCCEKWFPLRDKHWDTLPGIESKILLKLALVYSAKHDPSVWAETFQQEDDVAIRIEADQDEETEEEALLRRKELERLERERHSTMYSKLKQGDYQIQVHVIEARDLKGENWSGTSDPYCKVEIMGVTKKTSVKTETVGCVFDEILFFHFKNIGRNELKQAAVKLSVFDYEYLGKHKLIGSYQVDALSVYFRPHHELYRQWIAVHDYLNEKDRGIQGFVQISITVIGPGDAILVHDREAEIAKELLAANSAVLNSPEVPIQPLDAQSMVLLPPTIDLKLHFFVVKVFKAEDLPAMDDDGLITSSGIDAFVQIGFGVNAACKSVVRTVKGTANLSPVFLEEMWIPVMVPTLSRYISISVWDRDLGRPSELVGLTSYDYNQVALATTPGGLFAPLGASSSEVMKTDEEATDVPDKVELRWFNLYGPPLQRISKKRGLLVARNPEFGSTYRGRVLLSMERVETPQPTESEKFHKKPMKETDISKYANAFPKTIEYVLRCALFCGVDVPQFPTLTSSKTKMRVSISMGSNCLYFDTERVPKDGIVSWEDCKDSGSIRLPVDLTQVPDIIITLERKIDKDVYVSVSYVRLSAADTFRKGFTSKPQWLQLHEDLARRQTKYALDATQSPGTLLLRLGFGRQEIAARNAWGDNVSLFSPFRDEMVCREVRVHIFQLRSLIMPETRTSLPNPFIAVHCCGQIKKTDPRYKTLNPLFNETLVFVVNVPQNTVFSPDLVFRIHDASVSRSSEIIPSGFLGEIRLPMSKAVKTVAKTGAPRPQWHKLQKRRYGPSGLHIEENQGSGLISLQYIDSSEPNHSLVTPEKIVPEYELANLEVVALGIRKLKALSMFGGIQRPHLELELVGGMFEDGTYSRKTKPSSSSKGKNANFMEHLVLPAMLPLDIVFAPQLHIKVCEAGIGGIRTTTIASCVIDLTKKLPWSPEYVPPQQQQQFTNPRPVGSPVHTKPKDQVSKKSRFTLPGILKDRGKKLLNLSGAKKQDPQKDGDSDIALLNKDGEANDEEEIEQADDGIGIGEFNVPTITEYSSAPITHNVKQLDDPARLQQKQNEQQRRYEAGQADMLRTKATNYDAPLSSDSIVDAKQPTFSAPYMDGRDWWIKNDEGEELENYLKVKALETYPLYRSVLTRPSLLQRKRVRVQLAAGVFKGLITVTERHKKKGTQSKRVSELLDMERLKEPQSLVVRVYVLRGSNLQSKDRNGFSDPYLRLKLGKEIISDRAHYRKKTLNPDFFRMFSFDTELPGPSQLEIAVWDHDLVLDDLIGTTTIDLEDRWFHKDWQALGRDHPKFNEVGCMKPVEYRHLYTPKRTTSQGYIQLWVDILTAQQAANYDAITIAPPEPNKFEVRIVVWRGDSITNMEDSDVNDFYVKLWMEGGASATTDTHWRCSNGKPCWNWRIKLPVEFPLRTAEFGRLHIQLWNKDLIKIKDMIGEAQLDLFKWIRRANDENRSVSPFAELKAMSKVSPTNKFSSPGVLDPVQEKEPFAGGEFSDEEPSENDDVNELLDIPAQGTESQSLLQKNNKTTLSVLEKADLKRSNMKKTLEKSKPKFLTKPSTSDLRKTKEAKKNSEATAALNGIKDLLGLGDLPEDGSWINIHYTDREAGVSKSMGTLGISIQIVPETEAKANPVGKGREAPNMNPYLSPPVGRMQFSANPFSMLKVLLGPTVCRLITGCCCCVGCIMFLAVFGSTFMSTMTYLQQREATQNAAHFSYALPVNLSSDPSFQLPGN